MPESWPRRGRQPLSVDADAAADWVLSCPDIEGLTLSGGEPMLQAAVLVELVDRVRTQRDLGLMCYTGFELEWLRQRGNPHQKALLDRTDLLVDGLYLAEFHADLLWRGSSNQRLIPLTDRYRTCLPQAGSSEDRSAGLEFRVETQGGFLFVGVPAQPGFRHGLESQLASRGIHLATRI